MVSLMLFYTKITFLFICVGSVYVSSAKCFLPTNTMYISLSIYIYYLWIYHTICPSLFTCVSRLHQIHYQSKVYVGEKLLKSNSVNLTHFRLFVKTTNAPCQLPFSDQNN